MCGASDSRRIAEKIADALDFDLVYSNGVYTIRSKKEVRKTNNIESARLMRGFTQKRLCEMVGISLKTYHRYVHEGKSIPSDKLLQLSEVLNCTTDYLLEKTKYTLITVTDKKGVPIALISNNRVVEKRGYKVLLT